MNQKRPRTLAERFWEKVRVGKPDECWEWRAYKNSDGYGALEKDGEALRAHRISYEINKGPIPKGMCVCHSCDNPSCVNPNHLWLGTQQQNIADREAKGRNVNYRGSDHGRAVLSEDDVREIRRLCQAGVNQYETAKKFGVIQAHVSRIHRRTVWKHLE